MLLGEQFLMLRFPIFQDSILQDLIEPATKGSKNRPPKPIQSSNVNVMKTWHFARKSQILDCVSTNL